jgi:hypothetical protein
MAKIVSSSSKVRRNPLEEMRRVREKTGKRIDQLEEIADVTVRKDWSIATLKVMRRDARMLLDYVVSRELMKQDVEIPRNLEEQKALLLLYQNEYLSKIKLGIYEPFKDARFWVALLHYFAVNGKGQLCRYRVSTRLYGSLVERGRVELDGDIEDTRLEQVIDDLTQLESNIDLLPEAMQPNTNIDPAILALDVELSSASDAVYDYTPKDIPAEGALVDAAPAMSHMDAQYSINDAAVIDTIDPAEIEHFEIMSKDLEPPEEDQNPLCLRTINRFFSNCLRFLLINGQPLEKKFKNDICKVVSYNAIVKRWYPTGEKEKSWMTDTEGKACFTALWSIGINEKRKPTIELLCIHTVLQLLQVDGIRTLSWVDHSDRPAKKPGRYLRYHHVTFRYVGHDGTEPQFITYGRVPASKHQAKKGDKHFKPFALGTRGAARRAAVHGTTHAATRADTTQDAAESASEVSTSSLLHDMESDLCYDASAGMVAVALLSDAMPPSFADVMEDVELGKQLMGSQGYYDFKCKPEFMNCPVFIRKVKSTYKSKHDLDQCSLGDEWGPMLRRTLDDAFALCGKIAGLNERTSLSMLRRSLSQRLQMQGHKSRFISRAMDQGTLNVRLPEEVYVPSHRPMDTVARMRGDSRSTAIVAQVSKLGAVSFKVCRSELSQNIIEELADLAEAFSVGEDVGEEMMLAYASANHGHRCNLETTLRHIVELCRGRDTVIKHVRHPFIDPEICKGSFLNMIEWLRRKGPYACHACSRPSAEAHPVASERGGVYMFRATSDCFRQRNDPRFLCFVCRNDFPIDASSTHVPLCLANYLETAITPESQFTIIPPLGPLSTHSGHYYVCPFVTCNDLQQRFGQFDKDAEHLRNIKIKRLLPSTGPEFGNGAFLVFRNMYNFRRHNSQHVFEADGNGSLSLRKALIANSRLTETIDEADEDDADDDDDEDVAQNEEESEESHTVTFDEASAGDERKADDQQADAGREENLRVAEEDRGGGAETSDTCRSEQRSVPSLGFQDEQDESSGLQRILNDEQDGLADEQNDEENVMVQICGIADCNLVVSDSREGSNKHLAHLVNDHQIPLLVGPTGRTIRMINLEALEGRPIDEIYRANKTKRKSTMNQDDDDDEGDDEEAHAFHGNVRYFASAATAAPRKKKIRFVDENKVSMAAASDPVASIPASVPASTTSGSKPTIVLKNYKCTIKNCKSVLSTSSSLCKHIRTQHLGQRVECQVQGCSYVAKTPTNLKYHDDNVHKANIRQREKMTCLLEGCGATFQRSNLRDHEKRYHGSRKLKCLRAHCTDSFDTKAELRIHEEEFHKYKDPVIHCLLAECGRSFKKSSESRHMANYHPQNKQVVPCDEENCTKTYSSGRELERHKRCDHPKQRFHCPIEECKSEYALEFSLRMHLRDKHKQNLHK